MARVLIVGRRSACYRAALRLGHHVYLWSSQPLHESRKALLSGWIEHDFELCEQGIPNDVIATARSFSPEFIIPATESSVMLAAALRGVLGLKGTSIQVAELAHDKYKMKRRAVAHDIPVTRFHLVGGTDTAVSLIENLGLPLVLKPVDESGATGVHVARTRDDVERHMKPGLLAETFLKGTEASVETFIKDGVPVFHNLTDYLHRWQKSVAPASLNEDLRQQIISINDKVITSLDIERGMTHAEFYLHESSVVFGEIAVRPPGGYYMELIERAYGFDPWEVYVTIECGITPPELPIKATSFAAVYMIHPGKGRITGISGADKIEQLPGVFEFELDVTVGDYVEDHVNTSNEVGHVLLEAGSEKEILEKISYIESELNITLEKTHSADSVP